MPGRWRGIRGKAPDRARVEPYGSMVLNDRGGTVERRRSRDLAGLSVDAASIHPR
jgi:hypothetical protein